MKKLIHLILLVVVIAVLSSSARANTYTVTLTTDATGSATLVGTLRWAFTQANSNTGADTVTFNIATLGNTFENDGAGNSWAVIALTSALPALSQSTLVDGTTQPDTNLGFIPGRTVGVDNIMQGNINYPDVYIVPASSYTFPIDDSGLTGNGLAINSPNVTIKGLAISGFGNMNTEQPKAIAHADISVLYTSSARTMNTLISDCFLSCDPRGALPTITVRQTKGDGVLILGNNNTGTVKRNYISHSSIYGIVFHANQDNVANTTPNMAPCSNWIIEENQIIDIGRSTILLTGGRAADGVSMLAARFTLVRNNYIADWEQFGIDIGHNADDNKAENNTLTGFVKTINSLPCGGIRTALSSQRDTVSKNVIYNNTSPRFMAGIYTDRSVTSTSSFPGASVRNNTGYLFSKNLIHDNQGKAAGNWGSGIMIGTLSSSGSSTVTGVTITQNTIYQNQGLGIDLNFADTTGSTLVTPNDSGDGDSGPNNLQNFPMVDSSRFNSTTNTITIWGKGPATSTMEFFVNDGQTNNFTGLGLNYGEGKTYLGSAVEGSASDGATGTASYNVDNSIASNNANLFKFSFSIPGIVPSINNITATATLSGSTSEFGPQLFILQPLAVDLLNFTGNKNGTNVTLNWDAICNKRFDRFSLEYSTNGINYITLGNIVPQKRNGTKETFSFVHVALAPSNYYRLKMANTDSKYQYSSVIVFNDEDAIDSHPIYPNPVYDHFNASVGMNTEGSIKLQVYNNNGHLVLTKTIAGRRGINTLTAGNLGALPKGMYVVTISYEGKLVQEKIMKL